MHFRSLKSRLVTRLVRGNACRLITTFLGCLLILAVWWWGWQKKLLLQQHQLEMQINNLEIEIQKWTKKLDKVALYTNPNQPLNAKKFSDDLNQVAVCRTVINQAEQSGLILQSYSQALAKSGFKQLSFNFSGNYSELLNFLSKTCPLDYEVSSQCLKVTEEDGRLQIGYGCGIHTVVSDDF